MDTNTPPLPSPSAPPSAPPSAGPGSERAVRQAVRERYGQIAGASGSCCAPSCCAPAASDAPAGSSHTPLQVAEALGYDLDEVGEIPDGANLGLSCGNPLGLAGLQPGETVLDLGSGAGFDCFLAAGRVGPEGRVLGVDMTPQMVERARAAAEGRPNVEFRLGEIERLPVADGIVDVVISNCVINLSPDKPAVLREVFRVLRPGGRVCFADIVSQGELDPDAQSTLAEWTSCLAGAASIQRWHTLLEEAGFEAVRILDRADSRELIEAWGPGSGLADRLLSATIEARRPLEGAA